MIMASYPSERYLNAPMMEPTALINLHIIAHSQTKEKDWEGCLSLPGIRALVPRYTQVEVSYFDREGREQNVIFKDFLARLFQHEYDHLLGAVFLDRVESTKDVVMEKEYQRIMSEKEDLESLL